MFEETANSDDDGGVADFLAYRDYCDSAPAPWPTADLNVWGVNACVTPDIIFRRGFCVWLIDFTKSPCNNLAPDPVECLGVQGVEIIPDIVLPQRVPRAARGRSRRSRTIRGRASKSSDGDGGPRCRYRLNSTCEVQ